MNKNRRTSKKKVNTSFFATRPGRISLLVGAGLILLFFFLRGPRGTIELFKNTQKRNQLQDDIEELQRTKAELDSEKVLLNDDQYIEKTAREQYNMKKQGEKIYKIKKDSN